MHHLCKDHRQESRRGKIIFFSEGEGDVLPPPAVEQGDDIYENQSTDVKLAYPHVPQLV